MSDLRHLHDKKFAIIMVDDDGTKDGDWIVLTGKAKWRDGHLFVNRGLDVPEFPIPDDALDRIKQVTPDVKDILEEANYSILLTVGQLPEDANPESLVHTGFKWPDKKDNM